MEIQYFVQKMKLALLRLVDIYSLTRKAAPPKSHQLNDVNSVGMECLEEEVRAPNGS